jgi:hypothetical protein
MKINEKSDGLMKSQIKSQMMSQMISQVKPRMNLSTKTQNKSISDFWSLGGGEANQPLKIQMILPGCQCSNVMGEITSMSKRLGGLYSMSPHKGMA